MIRDSRHYHGIGALLSSFKCGIKIIEISLMVTLEKLSYYTVKIIYLAHSTFTVAIALKQVSIDSKSKALL